MNYDEAMDYERLAWDNREENVSDEVYVIHDGTEEVFRTYSYDDLKRHYATIDDTDGLKIGLIIAEDIDPTNWNYTMDLMTPIKL